MNKKTRISIIGSVGVPANYGGFETLVDNLVKYHHEIKNQSEVIVYCSKHSYEFRPEKYLSAELKYVPIKANGPQSLFYDIYCMILAIFDKTDVILVLGVSGAIFLPFIRLISKSIVITNIDGIEWRRKKWKWVARQFLHFSESIAVRFSHKIISDNQVIADYVIKNYNSNSYVISYGGDHAIKAMAAPFQISGLSANYAMVVCRIEPENNVHIILEALSRQRSICLLVIGNWNNGAYGKELRNKYEYCPNIIMMDPIYDLSILKTLRSNAKFYIHGHSAGGTNPSLVEAMFFGLPIFAFDCDFNRATTMGEALYFSDCDDLLELLSIDCGKLQLVASNIYEIANKLYTWSSIGDAYFQLFEIE